MYLRYLPTYWAGWGTYCTIVLGGTYIFHTPALDEDELYSEKEPSQQSARAATRRMRSGITHALAKPCTVPSQSQMVEGQTETLRYLPR